LLILALLINQFFKKATNSSFLGVENENKKLTIQFLKKKEPTFS
jgi:hypothetical protein